MKIDRRITNGLAWAGVLLVVGVPAADYISGHFMGDRDAAPQVAVIEPAAQAPTNAGQSAPAAAAQTQVAANTTPATGGTAVDNFVQSGRKLPSYITGGSDTPAPAKPAVTPPAPAKPVATAPTAPAATTPARPPIVTTPATPQPAINTPVAAIPPAKIAPVPMPLSMRPRSVATVTQQPRTPAEPVIIPPNVAPTYVPDVSAEDLEDWETGPLSEFLARRDGGAQRARPQQQVQPRPAEPYYPNGGYLDQIQPQGDRYVGPVGSPFPFTN